MFGRERALAICQAALRTSKADQTEAVVIGGDLYLTRFATNYIHQNVGERSCRVQVRAVFGRKVGSAMADFTGAGALEAVVRRAEALALLQPDNPEWSSLPGPAREPYAGATFDEETANCPAARRAESVASVVGRARRAGLGAAGSCSTAATEIAVANSLGVLAYSAATSADLTTVVSGENGSGYADRAAPAVGLLDPEKAGDTAVQKALMSQDPQPLEPGEYTVILEPAAVADMLTFLGFLGFSAQAVQEGRSFMAGKIGTKIMGENVTIWDDGADPAGRPIPFDFEGIPKRKVLLVENGVARGVVHDSSTAAREGVENTGHALPAPNVYGPLPLNLFMAPGESSVDEMIASTGRGVLVTRFHYTNPVHPVRAVITGMTRDGTYLIEGGRITHPVVNMRFTDSIIRALSQVTAIGRDRKLQAGFLGGALVPALRVNGFSFTGATEL